MRAETDFTVHVSLERREDGGLRAWSEAVPELVLSGADAEQVLRDIPNALATILSYRFGGSFAVEEAPMRSPSTQQREFTARAA